MYVHAYCTHTMSHMFNADLPLIGLCVPASREPPAPLLTPTTFTVGVLLLLLGEGEFGDEGLIAIRLGICETFTTVGAFGSVGAEARRGVGGELLPAVLSIGRSIICTLPGCVTLGAWIW